MINQSLKEKIDKSYNGRFLGNALSFSDEEKSAIYDEVSLILRRVGKTRGETLNRQEYAIVMKALVELTKEWNSDEDSWLDYISKKLLGLQGEIRGKIYQQICHCIDELAGESKLFVLDCYTKKYYASVCCHAFSPKISTHSFFDLCWEIYCKDLFQQYSPNDPILEVIVASLNRKFQSVSSDNDDDITIGSKVYSIRAGIKGLALIEDKSFLLELLNETLGTIHSLMNCEPITNDTYLKSLLQEWWRNKEASFGERDERRKAQRTFIATDYSQIKPKYVLENGTAKIVIPPIRLHDQFDCEPIIETTNRDITLIKESIPTFGSGIVMTTKEMHYPIDTLVDDTIQISVTISHGPSTIFQSQKTLYREYIVFCGNRESVSHSLLPGTYFLYSTNIEGITLLADIQRLSKNLYSVAATDGDVIRSLDRIVFFETEKQKRDLYITANEKRNIVYRKGDTLYKLLDGDLFLDVDTDYNIANVGIRYEGGAFRLSDFDRILIDDRYRFNISMLAEPGEAVTISVFRYSDNSILDVANIVKFNNISITFDKTLYYGADTTGKVHFKTERYDLEGRFDASDEESALPFRDGELLFSPPILKWRIDQADWSTVPNNGLYYKNISNTSVLEIELPFDRDCVVGLTNGKIIEPENTKHSYKIGQLIHSLDENSMDDGTITLFVKTGHSFFELIRFYLRQSFSADPIFVRSKEFILEWNPASFVGTNAPIFSLQVADSSNVVYQQKMSAQKQESIDLSKLKENYYTISVWLEGKGFLVKRRELLHKKILLGNIKNLRFRNKVLKITEAMLFDKISPERIRPIYIAELKYLGNKEGSDFYSGRLFVYNRYSERRYLDFINTTKINPVRVELKTMLSCYLGYGLDENDPEFEFDNEFVIDSDGMTTIGNCAGTRPKYVDYFIFEA